jgi:hypothetical protein
MKSLVYHDDSRSSWEKTVHEILSLIYFKSLPFMEYPPSNETISIDIILNSSNTVKISKI